MVIIIKTNDKDNEDNDNQIRYNNVANENVIRNYQILRNVLEY